MARSPKVLLLDEPTRGLDVRAKRDVHDVVRELAAAGKGIIVSSSEAEEIAALCHRAHRPRPGEVARGARARRAHGRQHLEVCNSMSANMTEIPIPAEPVRPPAGGGREPRPRGSRR